METESNVNLVFGDGAEEGTQVSSYLINILDNIKNSKKSKRTTALSHFDDFLRVYWRERKKEEPPEGGKSYETLRIEDLDCELFGCFANYLANCNNKTEEKRGNSVPIALNSALGYFSAVNFFYRT